MKHLKHFLIYLLGFLTCLAIMYDWEDKAPVVIEKIRDTCDHSNCMAKVKGCLEYKQVTN